VAGARWVPGMSGTRSGRITGHVVAIDCRFSACPPPCPGACKCNRRCAVDTEDAVVGLLAERDGIAALALRNFGLGTEEAIADVSGQRKAGEERAAGTTRFWRPVRMALECALQEAYFLGQHNADTEHALLGLLRTLRVFPDSAFARCGCDVDGGPRRQHSFSAPGPSRTAARSRQPPGPDHGPPPIPRPGRRPSDSNCSPVPSRPWPPNQPNNFWCHVRRTTGPARREAKAKRLPSRALPYPMGPNGAGAPASNPDDRQRRLLAQSSWTQRLGCGLVRLAPGQKRLCLAGSVGAKNPSNA
jgi:hypothetical protein